MLFNKNQLLQALENQVLQHNVGDKIIVNEVVIDSRKAVKNTLFFALKGENNDGHNFLTQSFTNGCEIAIIDNPQYFDKFKNNNLILVKNSFLALYELAKFSRLRSKAKIIAITGSVGKTGVKEMLKNSLAKSGKTYATIGNLNNHFGLPLTLCNMPIDAEFAVLEMGMNHLNEIEPLSKLARPHIAIITTIAPAHIGNFNNEEEIALAKSEIFSGLENQGFVLINRDNKYYDFLKNRALICGIDEKNILSFGQDQESDYILQSLDIKASDLSEIKIKTKNHGEFSYEISTSHKAIIFNSLIIIACLDLLLKDLGDSLLTLKEIELSAGRGKILKNIIDGKKITIIDDSYNANTASMKAALEYLMDLKNILKKERSIAILGDMFELGKDSENLHQEVLEYAKNLKIDLILLAGEEMKKAAKFLDLKNCQTYNNALEISAIVKNVIHDQDILLIKGSRGMAMEKTIMSFSL